MTKRTLDNTLYIHLKSVINQALPLEYAIRAARQAYPHEMAQLSKIDQKIRQYWIDLGASEAEIDAESLMDFAWDVIQVGFPLTHRHGRRYPDREFLDLIHRGLATVRGLFGAEVAQIRTPPTRYFRICDLLNGNDVLRLLNATARILEDSEDYKAADEIELEKFALGIREPIHIHPGMQYVVDDRHEDGRTVERFGIVLDTEMEFSMQDLERQIREFLYQFAARRESLRPPHVVDHISNELIDEFLRDELLGRINKHNVQRRDGFTSLLSGLYCWDLVQQYRQEGKKSAVDEAIVSTLAIYPKNAREVGEDAIRKNYNTARVAIDKVSFDGATANKPRRPEPSL
ncbi:hypothetical protein [Paraburkholderia terrae]|uniref:hypothetical protein n=1 Tax=Paraburkholderia terrae TaxID=311230 RepID=UPI001EE1DF09|nr:hypothetical protein [Paraburkholderia terrae]GJG99147.1 hypothetical protein CBA19C8_01345 [Paraburkholderia terrae]